MSDGFTVTVDAADVLRMLQRAEHALAGLALRDGLLAGALVAETAMKQSIQAGPKSGRTYARGRRVHQASAPGQPPATDTGNLVNSIHSESRGNDATAVVVGAEYGAPLEYGTARMGARPFVRPVADGKQDEIIDAVRRTVRAALERGT